jgi:hypothetical protein
VQTLGQQAAQWAQLKVKTSLKKTLKEQVPCGQYACSTKITGSIQDNKHKCETHSTEPFGHAVMVPLVTGFAITTQDKAGTSDTRMHDVTHWDEHQQLAHKAASPVRMHPGT